MSAGPVRVNGLDVDVAPDADLASVVASVSVQTRGIAVAVNGLVVPRGAWPDTPVRGGDVVEVVTAVQGG